MCAYKRLYVYVHVTFWNDDAFGLKNQRIEAKAMIFFIFHFKSNNSGFRENGYDNNSFPPGSFK